MYPEPASLIPLTPLNTCIFSSQTKRNFGLVKKYGSAATDDACAAALELCVTEYRFVRRYLERRPQAPLSLRQIDPLIRELTEYRDLIQQRIHFEETNP